MKAKCIKGFAIEKCDEDGCTIPNKYYTIKEDSIWDIDEEESNKFIGGEVRLTRDIKRGCAWIEIPKEMFEKHFEIQDRVVVINIKDEMGTHVLQADSFIVKCKRCGKERPLLKSDMQGNNIKPVKCECGGENQFRYWLDGIYTEEEYAELEMR